MSYDHQRETLIDSVYQTHSYLRSMPVTPIKLELLSPKHEPSSAVHTVVREDLESTSVEEEKEKHRLFKMRMPKDLTLTADSDVTSFMRYFWCAIEASCSERYFVPFLILLCASAPIAEIVITAINLYTSTTYSNPDPNQSLSTPSAKTDSVADYMSRKNYASSGGANNRKVLVPKSVDAMAMAMHGNKMVECPYQVQMEVFAFSLHAWLITELSNVIEGSIRQFMRIGSLLNYECPNNQLGEIGEEIKMLVASVDHSLPVGQSIPPQLAVWLFLNQIRGDQVEIRRAILEDEDCRNDLHKAVHAAISANQNRKFIRGMNTAHIALQDSVPRSKFQSAPEGCCRSHFKLGCCLWEYAVGRRCKFSHDILARGVNPISVADFAQTEPGKLELARIENVLKSSVSSQPGSESSSASSSSASLSSASSGDLQKPAASQDNTEIYNPNARKARFADPNAWFNKPIVPGPDYHED